MSVGPYPLFACVGVELEYMIVRRDDLRVVPWSDRVLRDEADQPCGEIERGPIAWSNELTAHVIELKTARPVASLDGLAALFAAEVAEINRRLAPIGARLLPTAMHPTMRPEEAVLWAHDSHDIYAAFDHIFDCRGHGWSNLQSMHLNLPFAGDEEFARLHAAIRLVLPWLPALAASSPLVEGRVTGRADNRLGYYRGNSARLPALAGRVMPEPVYSEEDYAREIYAPIATALAPHDPAGLLEPVFANARGAIARFDRGSIEIRLLDLQESPAADLALARVVIHLLRELVAGERLDADAQRAVTVERLLPAWEATVEQGGRAQVTEEAWWRRVFGVKAAGTTLMARDLWTAVMGRMSAGDKRERAWRELYQREGTLADRIVAALGEVPDGAAIRRVYGDLAECPANNRLFGRGGLR
jgi:glutamate---cysteine ligase / carboxylate-amine ligase